MSPVSKRASLGVLTVAGLVLAGIGLWFLSHLGLSGSGAFSAKPSSSRIVVLDPSVLNRVDSPVTVTAKARDGGEVWIGRASPGDARALVGKAAATSVTGVSVGGWQLQTAQRGTGQAPALAGTDVWRQQAGGKGAASLTVTQEDAPETVVVATASGKPADLTDLTLEWKRPAWSLEALGALLVGLLLAAGGVAGLLRLRRDGAPEDATSPEQAVTPESLPTTQSPATAALPTTPARTSPTPATRPTTTPRSTSEEARR